MTDLAPTLEPVVDDVDPSRLAHIVHAPEGRAGAVVTEARVMGLPVVDPRLAAPGHRDRAGGEPQFGPDSVRLTIQEALVLQSFPAGHPVQGSMTAQFRQVGNAVPPLLAAHVIAAATGLTDRLHHRLGAAS